jgi:hypothetical protein
MTFCKKMKKLTPTVIVAILTLVSLISCKPNDVPAKSKGHSLGSAENAVTTEALIQVLQQNDFDLIEGKTFDEILPDDIPSDAYVGMVALRDTTAGTPNEFLVGVGPDIVIWFKSHNVSGNDAIADWEVHVQKRIALVERLAANKP